MATSDIVHIHILTHRDQEGVTTAAVAPAWGANVLALSFRASDWTWPVPVLESADIATLATAPTSFGMPILGPTPGRVGRNQSGRMIYHGKAYRLFPTRHGFLRHLAWKVGHSATNALTCSVDVEAQQAKRDYGFPFQFHAEYNILLAAANLRSRLRFTNTGNEIQPLALGWHPYFHCSGECRVRIPASARWRLDNASEPTPTGELLAVDGQDDFRSGRLVSEREHWDDVFTDLAGEEGVSASWVEEITTILKEDGTEISARLRRFVKVPTGEGQGTAQPIPNLQLYTPRSRRAIALEPLSAPPNALNLLSQHHEKASVCELTPGASAVFQVVVGLEVAAP